MARRSKKIQWFSTSMFIGMAIGAIFIVMSPNTYMKLLGYIKPQPGDSSINAPNG